MAIMGEWISVKNKSIPLRRRVLVTDGIYLYAIKSIGGWKNFWEVHATHWMLAPKLPAFWKTRKQKFAKYSAKVLIPPGEQPSNTEIEKQKKRWSA